MVNCERFEEEYQAWQNKELSADNSSAMQDHVNTCEHCRTYNPLVADLRTILLDLPQLKPSPGFEAGLMRKIKDDNLNAVPLKQSGLRLLPRWAALGSGLAFGLVIGLIFVYPLGDQPGGKPGSLTSPYRLASEQQVGNDANDTLDRTDDSLLHSQPFDIDRHSTVVSSDK